ncbi:Protein zntA [Frankliniella fusca]|uniref:Protein zntA n=1 Tax=Frankliniella fusca TaxID=407009 RepID=A0AAE1HKT0_9NEOP|nr:Protein zntA [Frankliniella fusca]
MDQSAAGPSRRSGRTRKETQIRCDQCYLTLPSNEYATHLSQHHASAASTTPDQVPGPSNEPPLHQKRMVSRDRPKTPAAPTRRRKKGQSQPSAATYGDDREHEDVRDHDGDGDHDDDGDHDHDSLMNLSTEGMIGGVL